MTRVTTITCDGCSKTIDGENAAEKAGWLEVRVASEGFPTGFDGVQYVNGKMPPPWVNRVNHYDLCAPCIKQMMKAMHPPAWVRSEDGQ